MSEEHKISPFFKRRLDHHKFEKMMRSGISYMYFESKNLEQFKYKLVKATLENYIHYKYNLDIENLPKNDVDNFIDYMIETYDALLKMYYYNERKIRGSINENYSPAGKEITANKIVIHKSNPKFRDIISNEGLKVRAGECYKIYAGYGEKCIPAIFATNSINKRASFDSTYDDDVWEIDTEMIPDVKWYKDRHYESSKKHIVTFENIPADAITLKHEGTGKDWGLMESVDKFEDKKLKLVTKIIHEFFDEVSFIEIKKYENKPMIIVYFDNDEDAANEETYFAEQIQDKIYEYTGIKLIPYWRTIQYNTDADFRLDAIKLKYDNLGNVINESTFFRRRVDISLMDKEFFENLSYVTSIFLKRYNEGKRFDMFQFKTKVLNYLMDNYHGELSNGGLNDFSYDEIYESLSNHFHDKIKDRYDTFFGNNINESEENKKEKNSNYLEMIKELIEPFKKEDCVCNIKVSFDDDMYDIYLEFGTEELNDKFYSVVGKHHYVKNLKIKVKNTIKNYLSIDNLYVGSYGIPRCGWTKN